METEFTGRIESLTRLNNSASGNPRYRVKLVGGANLVTVSDAQVNNLIGNPEYQGVEVVFTMRGREVSHVRRAGPTRVPVRSGAGETVACAWFALCTNDATGTQPHPVLGDVAICESCKARL